MMECKRGVTHLITECSCDDHMMCRDAERFAEHLRNYVNMVGLDITGLNNQEITARSLMTLKKLADDAEQIRAVANMDWEFHEHNAGRMRNDETSAPPHHSSGTAPR